jgi:pyruvate ferredoxin oxidoreductase beta subunit
MGEYQDMKLRVIPLPEEELFVPGHSACAGCGEALAVRIAMKALGKNTIVCLSTGCLEVFSTQYRNSAWKVPVIHMLFENTSAVASGVEVAMRRMGKDANVAVFAGDGATADIGFASFSGMLERGHNIIYICLDNEAYMNTGVQRSGLTPFAAHTTTSPSGRQSMGNISTKKDILSIAIAHGVPYVATASIAHPEDIYRKVSKAASIGQSYVQIHVPCPTGWGFDSSKTVEVAKLALETRLWINYEAIDGEIANVMRVNKKPVEDYLKLQKRFRHLFRSEEGKEIIGKIQEIADKNAERFGLL